ncbi:MAG: DUF1129 family protein [Peptococcaceae bacterium]
MLSKKSEQFLAELRMYLISRGKNDAEINEIAEELHDHLLQAEKEGKDVAHIIGESSQNYMKTIGRAMKTDFHEMAGLVPMVILLLAAYFSFVPALKGVFSLSEAILLIALTAGILGMIVYGVLLFKVFPKFLNSRWLYILTMGTVFLVTGLGVSILLWYQRQGFKPFFIATPLQNNLIIVLCIIIFIASAVYTKAWISIIIPILMAIGPLGNRFIPPEINRNPVYIILAVVLAVILAVVFIYLIGRRKKK